MNKRPYQYYFEEDSLTETEKCVWDNYLDVLLRSSVVDKRGHIKDFQSLIEKLKEEKD